MKIVQNIITCVYLLIIGCAIAFSAFQVWKLNDMTVKVGMSIFLSWVIVLGIRAIIQNRKLINKTE